VKVEALTATCLDEAAELLAATQRAGEGPASGVWRASAAAEVIAASLPGALALAAMERGVLVGFLVVPLPGAPGADPVRILDHHHAADPGRARDAYRALYAPAAASLVGFGCFHHVVRVLIEPPGAVQAFGELGFGVDQIKGVQPLGSRLSATGEPGEAGLDDVDELVSLYIELATYHARSPVLRPAALDVAATRSELVDTVEDPRRTILVARDGRRIIGMIEAHPDARHLDTVTIGLNIVTERARSRGVGTALLDGVLGWGLDAGYRHCAVSWASANLVSDAFYRARGFVPFRYELVRRIDPEVSWANERLDYSLLG
jgi:GNAT superfamily N-acetyltransferase